MTTKQQLNTVRNSMSDDKPSDAAVQAAREGSVAIWISAPSSKGGAMFRLICFVLVVLAVLVSVVWLRFKSLNQSDVIGHVSVNRILNHQIDSFMLIPHLEFVFSVIPRRAKTQDSLLIAKSRVAGFAINKEELCAAYNVANFSQAETWRSEEHTSE